MNTLMNEKKQNIGKEVEIWQSWVQISDVLSPSYIHLS